MEFVHPGQPSVRHRVQHLALPMHLVFDPSNPPDEDRAVGHPRHGGSTDQGPDRYDRRRFSYASHNSLGT